jgi:hypothetical protein
MTRINVDEAVLRGAVETIESLRKELATARGEKAPLATAIEKSVENVAQGDTGRNRTVTNIVRPAMFSPRDVAKQRKSAAEKREANRDALRKAKGLRPSKYKGREL